MRAIQIVLLSALLALAGCATVPSSPVSIRMAAPPGSLPPGQAITVVPEPGEVDWSAEQALRSTGQAVALDSPWRLRVSERPILRSYPGYGFSCYPSRWSGYPMGPWGYDRFGWPYDPWCDSSDRIIVRRTITWILEDAHGQVFWQASARESQMDQPPDRASMHLAQSLSAWRHASMINP